MKIGKQVGRNDPCPCGSGLKYKACCQGKKEPEARSGKRWVVIGIIAVLVIAAVAKAISDNAAKKANNALPIAGGESGLVAQPPGPAPAGKVWSPEHGHWHDAPGAGFPMSSPAPGLGASKSPPPGPAPAGKVWSAEHGHWHDVAPGPN